MNRELIARVAHEINRAYCASMGDDSQPAWDDAPEWQRASAMAGVDMHLANPDATPEQSHESWLAQKVADGWAYGEVKDAEQKQHPCCVPYAELPAEQKAKDYLFRAVVHQLKDVAEVSAPTPIVAVPATPRLHGLVAITYIGRRDQYVDRQYGTGLPFRTGQTRQLPAELARRFLRHADLFEQAQETVVEAVPVAEVSTDADDDTAVILEQVAAQQEADLRNQSQLQDLYDQVAAMDKDALAHFAMTRYQQKLDKRIAEPKLREEVISFIDRFGAV